MPPPPCQREADAVRLRGAGSACGCGAAPGTGRRDSLMTLIDLAASTRRPASIAELPTHRARKLPFDGRGAPPPAFSHREPPFGRDRSGVQNAVLFMPRRRRISGRATRSRFSTAVPAFGKRMHGRSGNCPEVAAIPMAYFDQPRRRRRRRRKGQRTDRHSVHRSPALHRDAAGGWRVMAGPAAAPLISSAAPQCHLPFTAASLSHATPMPRFDLHSHTTASRWRAPADPWRGGQGDGRWR